MDSLTPAGAATAIKLRPAGDLGFLILIVILLLILPFISPGDGLGDED